MPDRSLDQEIKRLAREAPEEILRLQIADKLRADSIIATKKRVDHVVESLMLEQDCEIVFHSKKHGPQTFRFDEEDVQAWEAAVTAFAKKELPKILSDTVEQGGQIVFDTFVKGWPQQSLDEDNRKMEFERALSQVWGDATDRLQMLHVIASEMCQEAIARAMKSKTKRNLHRREALIRLHGRGCQILSEIVTLLRAGHADGAMARWRSLHEVATVATVLHQGKDVLSEKYLHHDFVESKKSLDAYELCYQDLGYDPPSEEERREVKRAYEHVLSKFGKEFSFNYGWASDVVGKKRPTFADLEKLAGKAMMRSHYKFASYTVHAGPKGMLNSLSSPDQIDPRGIQLGPSLFGLEEPGQNAALSILQLCVTTMRRTAILDDTMLMIAMLEVQKSAVVLFISASELLDGSSLIADEDLLS